MTTQSEPSLHFNISGYYFRINRFDFVQVLLIFSKSNVFSLMFQRSTLNKPDYGPSFESKGKYNHPHVCGPVQMTDLSGSRWPSAEKIGHLSKLAHFDSEAFTLFGQEVISIETGKAEKQYSVKTTQGFSFETRKVILSTGLGKPKLACAKHPPSFDLIQS